MELKGKIIKLLPLQTGTSSRGEWRKQEFVVETPGQYPKQVCLYMWGDAIDNNKIEEGMEIKKLVVDGEKLRINDPGRVRRSATHYGVYIGKNPLLHNLTRHID